MSGTYAMYYDAPEKQEFDANVLSAEKTDGGYAVVLDRTLFYPEGGGQPADTGTLEEIPVLDVKKDDRGFITHLLASKPSGRVVHGVIDWSRRRDYMQQHTGEHLIAAALVRTGGYNTVAVHLGENYITIETDAADIPEDKLIEAEDLADRIICRNLPVRTLWIDESEIPLHPFRRPPKVSGRIRIVEIPEFDCAACGGVHVESTGEVRLVKLVGFEKIRGHVRTIWTAGDRAVLDYRRKARIIAELTTTLSSKEEELPAKIERLRVSAREAQAAVEAAAAERANQTAQRLLDGAELAGAARIVTAAFDGESPEFVRKAAETLSGTGAAACLTAGDGEGFFWAIVCPEHFGIPFSAFRDNLLPLVDGKGGGRPPLYQGGGRKPEGSQAFRDLFASMIRAQVQP